MPDKLIDYNFNDLDVSNPDGTFKATVQKATMTAGPGSTPTGNYPKAIDLGTLGRASVDVSRLNVDYDRFTVRVVFQANGPVSDRQNLVESNLLPFALFLVKGDRPGEFDLVASVAPKAHGWQTASTQFATGLKEKTWYTADLVYDIDTLGLFVDEEIVAVHAFPQGKIEKLTATGLFVGTWVDGARNHFDGKVAALQWYSGIPEKLESQLDEQRSYPEWFVTHKLETVRKRINLGSPTTKLTYDQSTDAYLQHYDFGAIMYQDGVGAAFEMHSAIYTLYKAMSNKAALGYLVSDDVATTKSGGRKSVFSKGAIYWSSSTGAVPVLDQLYTDYEALGESRAIGFPTKPALNIPGGIEQEFQGARMYFKQGDTNAHEVRGAILGKYLALGGPGTWGFPITNESDVKNGGVIGKFSEFERCTIYWSAQTGAFETHGDIRKKYLDLGGPAGKLGFPTSDELDIPGVSGPGRYNTFQKGSLLWYGSLSSMIFARPFRIHLGRISTDEEEGAFMGQNDIYIKLTVKDGPNVVYDQKHPSSGDWGGRNIVDVNFTIPVVITPNIDKVVTLIVDVWDSDSGAPFGGGDDHLGTWTKYLTAANAWGLTENSGILDSGSFSKVNSITASIQPDGVDINSLSETEKFWGVGNMGTDDLTYEQYASAFSDVDSDTEWWDLTDWLEKAFYELVVKDLAEPGNCFGMSLEAIYARKSSSLFSMPLNQFTNWNTIRPEINVKHCYQAGSGPIWWFLKEFITGNTHDPVDVFNRTRDEFNRGNHPVLCIAQNYDFSGKPHCILPVAWNSSSKPWKITICDPNYPNELTYLTVNPDNNTYEYQPRPTRKYSGGEWSGGRLHFMPFSVLCEAPRTPIWDAILLILAGTIVLLGDDAETIGITDSTGNDMDAFGERAKAQLQAGSSLNGYFAGFKGYGQTDGQRPRGTVAGELLMRMRPRSTEAVVGPAGLAPSVVTHLPFNSLTANRDLRILRDLLGAGSAVSQRLQNRTLHHVANDPSAMAELDAATRELITKAFLAGRPGDFRHTTAGRRNGQFRYAVKHALSQFKLDSTLATAERTEIALKDIGTSKRTVQVKADRDKLVRLEVDHKLGVVRDRIKITINQIPIAHQTDLQLNLSPGFGGIDLVTVAKQINALVEVEAVIDGSIIKRRFNVPLEGGTRLKLSQVLTDNSLGVARIDRVFGPSRQSKLIPGS